ncbi:hypothetical protein RND71_025901 [Anisodus tanguticus]|uniref:NADP-dependent oxidoreductase domain-containing protein n=1 Tax=Anisodus tanguticus TaxID=243964 RepID=A0AAE1V3A9_9SOLA|nr:hypothetical protein RND71_025901 [Anisodus tanguticus]
MEAPCSTNLVTRPMLNYLEPPLRVEYYGGTLSEKVLGKALEVPRNEYIVSTKCGRYKEGFDFSAERVIRSIDESLERLQLDYVDILQCHVIEFGSLHQIVNETLPTPIKLKQAGKIRFTGITGLPLRLFTYVLDWAQLMSSSHIAITVSTIQSLEDLLPYLKSKGVGVISASPLSMDLFTEAGPPEWHPASSKLKVEESIAAAVELAKAGMDEETIAEITDILKPVKNQTWPGGI